MMVSVFQGGKGQTFFVKKFSLSFLSLGMFTRSGIITSRSIITGILVTLLADSLHWSLLGLTCGSTLKLSKQKNFGG